MYWRYPPTTVNKSESVDVSAVNELKNLIASNPSKHGQTTRQKHIGWYETPRLFNLLYTYPNSKVDTGLKGLVTILLNGYKHWTSSNGSEESKDNELHKK